MFLQSAVACFIVDDNEIDRQAIFLKASRYDFLDIKGVFTNAIEALEALHYKGNMLLLLDIDMPELNGLELIKLLDQDTIAPILVTSHPEYALQSYEYNILDYLLKPVTSERFAAAMARVVDYFDLKTKASLYEMYYSMDTVLIKDGYDTVRLNLADIIYLEALKDYTKVVTASKTYLTSINLKESLTKLPPTGFLRIHRSYAVAKRQIRKMEQNEILLDRHRLPVGKTFKQDVTRFLKIGS